MKIPRGPAAVREEYAAQNHWDVSITGKERRMKRLEPENPAATRSIPSTEDGPERLEYNEPFRCPTCGRALYFADKPGKREVKIMDPQSIERESMRIIEEELALRGMLGRIPADRLHVVKRVIHTTADFDFAESLVFSDGAMEAAKSFVREKPVFITDTNMIATGINKKALAAARGSVRCYMAEQETERMAGERGVTRAAVSMERAAEEYPEAAYVIGNAPTALMRLCELIAGGAARPSLVVAVPVGFVNVRESKNEVARLFGTPFILSGGLKGGSTVAVAIVNALLYGG